MYILLLCPPCYGWGSLRFDHITHTDTTRSFEWFAISFNTDCPTFIVKALIHTYLPSIPDCPSRFSQTSIISY